MIKVTVNPKKFELKISGHAGADVNGKDIICAAASMLFYTYAFSCEASAYMMKKNGIKKVVEEGNSSISCKPMKEYEGNILRSLWTISVGFEMLSKDYPNYVHVEIIE